ncbi:MAG: hypothetical protein Q4D81_00530 [Eubacteriales bacterium]|nr:hypothetical protein [Eubacteriales bacterium]
MSGGDLYGVWFDNYHTFDWGLYIVDRQENKPPEPKIYTVDVPGGNGVIDVTEAVLGSVAYNNREITCEFYIIDENVRNWATLYSDIMAAIHGRKMRIVFDDDPGYYYVGRVSVTNWKSGRRHSILTVTCDCEPFKYLINAYGDDWLWDPFDFEYGEILDDTKTVNSSAVVTLETLKMPVTPTFRANKAMTVAYLGKTYSIPANKDITFYDLVLTEGTHNLTFKCSGTGTVKIMFTNGVL